MKKILLLAAALTVSAAAYSQNIQWGAKAGLNMSSISNTDDADPKISFHAGVFADVQINDFLSFQPELLYSRQGDVFKDGSDYKVWSQYNYVNVPLVVKLYVTEKLSVNIGPQFGFVIDAWSRVKFDGSTDSEKIDSDAYNSFDASAAMGLTYNMCQNIDVYARYNLGLTDMAKDNPSNDKFKNNVIQIGVGYRF